MTIEDKARQIFAERATFYTTSTVHTDPSVLAKLVELAAPRLDWAVLDIATGTGHTALALAPYVASVVSIDLTPEMLSEAERFRADHAVGNVSFRQGDVHHLPFEDARIFLRLLGRDLLHAGAREGLEEALRLKTQRRKGS